MKSNKMTITFPTLGRQAWQWNGVVEKEMLLSTRHKKQEAKERLRGCTSLLLSREGQRTWSQFQNTI
jgi:hypothetical protein